MLRDPVRGHDRDDSIKFLCATASWIFDCTFILLLVIASGFVRRFSRIDIGVYGHRDYGRLLPWVLVGVLPRWSIWLPRSLPQRDLAGRSSLFAPRSKDDPDLPAIAPSPPSL